MISYTDINVDCEKKACVILTLEGFDTEASPHRDEPAKVTQTSALDVLSPGPGRCFRHVPMRGRPIGPTQDTLEGRLSAWLGNPWLFPRKSWRKCLVRGNSVLIFLDSSVLQRSVLFNLFSLMRVHMLTVHLSYCTMTIKSIY